MAKNKMGLEIDLERLITSLDKTGSSVKDAVEEIQIASKEIVTEALVKDTVKGNYPAKGKYSTGNLAKSIDTDNTVKWSGYTAEVSVGYDMKKSGITSIMLLYGTPRMKKASKLYNDIYGKNTKDKIAEMQQKKLNEIIERAVSS